jgi:hypothetical protein
VISAKNEKRQSFLNIYIIFYVNILVGVHLTSIDAININFFLIYCNRMEDDHCNIDIGKYGF